VLLGLHVAALDALGERDLELRRQQRHAADRAQVQPQRIERRLDGEVELGLLGDLGRAVDGRLAGLGRGLDLRALRLRVAAVGADDVDALLRQEQVQLAKLLLGDIDLLERRRDVVERQKAALLALRDQGPKLIQFMDGRLVSQQNFRLDRSAPLRAALPSMPDGSRASRREQRLRD